MPIHKLIFTAIISFILTKGITQNTEYYFTQEGLSLASYFDYFSANDVNSSFTYFESDTICNRLVSVYFHNKVYWKYYYYFEGDQMYSLHPVNCQSELIYDFGLEVGETITKGKYKDFTLTDKYPVTLLNGEIRNRFDLQTINVFTSWIEGIGDIKYGNSKNLYEFEGQGVFICSKLNGDLLWQNEEEIEKCEEYACLYPKVKFETEIEGLSININNMTLYGQSYEWDFGDGSYSNNENPSHTYANAGCYDITLSVDTGCPISPFEKVEKIIICIDEEIPDNMIDDNCDGFIDEVVNMATQLENPIISIYPNPASNVLNVDNITVLGSQIILYNINGEEITKWNDKSRLNVSQFSRGIYYLKIKSKDNITIGLKKILLL